MDGGGGRTGGQTDGRAEGRSDGRAEGQTDRQTDGRAGGRPSPRDFQIHFFYYLSIIFFEYEPKHRNDLHHFAIICKKDNALNYMKKMKK